MTTAELYHALLGPNGEKVHRDRARLHPCSVAHGRRGAQSVSHFWGLGVAKASVQ